MFGSSSSHVLEARVEASGIDKFESQMASAGGAVTSFEKKTLAAGGALAAISAGGIAKSISAASDLNATLTESQAIMGDLTQDQMKGMEDAAREVGRTTTFSASEAGEAFYFLASAGMDAEQSMAAVGDVAQFAQAGAFDLATATDLATDAQSALGLTAEDAAENQENLNRVMDTLVKSNQLANASVEEFSSALTNKAAAAMREAGIEIEEGASALATFADQGLKGRRAGTILARTIQGLQSSAQSNAAAFEDLGVSVYDSEGNMRAMADITGDLEGALAGMSTEQRNAAMNQLGLNDRAAQGLSLMMGNSDAMREYESQLQNAGGAAEEVSNNQLQSFQNQLKLLYSQLTDIAISIGNVFLPYLTRLVSGVRAAVQRFAEFNDRTDGMAGAITLVSGLISGLTMMGWALSSMLGTGLVPAAGSAAAAIAAIAAPVVAVGAVIGGVAHAWKTNFAGMRDAALGLRDDIAGPFSQTIAEFNQTVDTVLSTLSNAWNKHTYGVENRISGLVETVRGTLGAVIIEVLNTISGRLQAFRLAWESNSGAIQGAIDRILGYVQRLGSWVFEHLGSVVSFLTDVFKATWESAIGSIISIGESLFDLVVDIGKRFGIFGEDVNTLAEVLGQLLDPFRKVELAVSGVEDVFGRLADGWDSDWASIRTTTEQSTARVGELFGGMETDSSTSFAGIRANAEEQLFGAFTRIEQEVASLRGSWTTEFATLGSSARETFGMLWTIVEEILVPVFGTIVGVFRKHLGSAQELVDVHLGDMIAEFARTLTHLNENIVQPILAAIMVVWNEFGDEILTVIEITFDAILSAVKIAIDAVLTTIRVVMALIRGDWEEAWNLVAGFLERTLDTILSFASEWGGRFLDWLAGLLGDVIDYFKRLARNLIGGSIIPDMLSDILGAFETFGSDALEWLGGMVGDFISDVQSFAGDVVGEFESMGEDALSAFTSLDFASAGKDAVTDLASGLRDKIPSVEGAADAVANAYDKHMPGSDADTGPLSNLSEYGPTVTEMFAEGILDKVRKVQRAAETVASAAEPNVDHVASRAAHAAASRNRGRGQGGEYLDITVDARGAENPREVERRGERGVSKALDAYNVPR